MQFISGTAADFRYFANFICCISVYQHDNSMEYVCNNSYAEQVLNYDFQKYTFLCQ
jgi:hypothetical protein